MIRAPSKRPVVLTAVHPNAGVRAWYRAELERLIDAMHTDLTLRLQCAWAVDPPDIGYAADGRALAHDAPSPALQLQRLLEKWAKQWTRRLDRVSLSLAARFAARSSRATETSMLASLKQAGFTVQFKPTRKALETYRAVVGENVGLIKSIPQQYLKDVQTSVWQSVTKGADMAMLSRSIRKNYGVATRRAALIARDQNAKAKAVLENTRRQELGIERAVWQHSAGGKVPRPAHVAMNGKSYELAKGMWDRDEKEHVWPGQLINCRCTSRAIIPGFE